jgi:hypothetical protein
MRHAALLGTLAGMNQQRVILNAEIDHSVIHGTLTAADGQHRAFHGWLELSTALEALLLAHRPACPEPNGLSRGFRSDLEVNQMNGRPNHEAGQRRRTEPCPATNKHRNEDTSPAFPRHGRANARRARRRARVASQSKRRLWVLVRVWDGGVLGSFDAEASAREEMAGVDDDEVVVLSIGI